jgi:hypothetical protein
MPKLLITHEVEDVAHWLASPKRDEFFGPRGMTVTTFVDPGGTNRVGLLADVPSVEAFEASLAEPEAAEAMKYDGVKPETIATLVEG